MTISLFRATIVQPIFFLSARVTPFTLSVFTDGAEAVDDTFDRGAANDNEASSAGTAATEGETTGTMGFSLEFAQIACPWLSN